MAGAKILIIDDQEANRKIMSELMRMLGHSPCVAEDGPSGLEALRRESPDLVLLDIRMPGMDGYEVLQHIKDDPDYRHVPVLVVSGLDDMSSAITCIEKGADDYLNRPFNTALLKARVGACLVKKELHDRDQDHKRRIVEYNAKLEERVRNAVHAISSTQMATIFALSRLSESRDPETGEHLERMCEFAKMTAEYLAGLPKHAAVIDQAFIENIYAGAPLHDIGKVGIPDRILQKPGKLTEDEFEIMKAHTTIGARTLRAVDREHPGNAFVRMGIEIAEAHHEKWDGTGYPHGLAGEDTPLPGRILALADVYDALTSKRCYKDAYSHEKSAAIIIEGRGTHFDPDVVDAFQAREAEFIDVRRRHEDTEKAVLA